MALKFRGWGGGECHPRPLSRDFKETKLQRYRGTFSSLLALLLTPTLASPPVLCGSHQHGAGASWINFLPECYSQAPFLFIVSLAVMASVPGEASRLSHTQPRRAEGKRPPGERLPGLCRSQIWSQAQLSMAILKCFVGTCSFLVSFF